MQDTPRKPLDDWLGRIGARRLWTVPGPGPLVPSLERYEAPNRAPFLVVNLSDGGWDLYVPASSLLSTQATLYAAERALGLRD